MCFETRVPTSRAHLKDAVLIYWGAKVLLESSTPSKWVARHVESMGMEVIVADPNFAPMYATRSKKLKTDKRDARCLAQACKLGAYKPAHRRSDEQRRVRMQLDVRQTLVETRTRLTNQLGALLHGRGYQVATGAAENYARRLEALELPSDLREQLGPHQSGGLASAAGASSADDDESEEAADRSAVQVGGRDQTASSFVLLRRRWHVGQRTRAKPWQSSPQRR